MALLSTDLDGMGFILFNRAFLGFQTASSFSR